MLSMNQAFSTWPKEKIVENTYFKEHKYFALLPKWANKQRGDNIINPATDNCQYLSEMGKQTSPLPLVPMPDLLRDL